jgi:type 1 glutamine amidotransferase
VSWQRAVLLPLLAGLAAWAAPLKVLIVTGSTDEPYHHWRETTPAIRALLERSGRFEVTVTEEPRALNAAALMGYAAVVLNYNGPRLGATAESALEGFVRNGGGFIAFHQASYGAFFGQTLTEHGWRMDPAQSWPEFARIIGARWAPASIGHARRGVFEVAWKDAAHPVAQGLPSSFLANDELYHRLTLAADADVLADALDSAPGGTLQREPMIWTHRYGAGRVYYTTLGHDTTAWFQPGFQAGFERGVEWAASGAVTLAPPQPRDVPRKDELRLLVVTGGHPYPTAFYAMLDSLSGVHWTHATNAAEAYARPLEQDYDVVLLHDMPLTTTPQQRERLRAFVEAGHGIVALHHAIVDYPDWPWWYENVIGGNFFVQAVLGHPASRYHEGVDFVVNAVEAQRQHPVLHGVPPLAVHDEAYRGMAFYPGITVLMETSFAENDPPVVYVGPYRQARVVYIQLGHSASTMQNPGFRQLVSNAVQWCGRHVN